MSGSGDSNFKHAKLDSPMEYPHTANRCCWFTFVPSPFRSPPRASISCKPKCVTRSICLTQMITFYIHDSSFRLEPDAERWMLPGETSPDRLDPENIWISGSGGSASLVCLEKKWWVLFGTFETKWPEDRPDLPKRETVRLTMSGKPGNEKFVRRSHFVTKTFVLHEMTWEPWNWKPGMAEDTKRRAKTIFLRGVSG